MVRKTLASAVLALSLLAPAAHAQELDVARGEATVIDGLDTTIYDVQATSGPVGESATGTIFREFVGPGATSTVFARVTCLAVSGNRAAVIGEVLPTSVNVGYTAILLQIYDGTLELQPDGVATGTDPKIGSGVITFTECGAFLPPFPFNPRPITLGDFQVIDTDPPPPPPPPPGECEEDEDDDDDDGGDDDCDDDGDDDG